MVNREISPELKSESKSDAFPVTITDIRNDGPLYADHVF